MDEVMMWLMNYCLDHGIGVVYRNDLPVNAPSVSYQDPNLIIFNDNYNIESLKPFMLAHEIGHVLDGNPGCNKHVHGNDQEEAIADNCAIKLLWEYCLDQDVWFETTYQFAKAFSIPSKKIYLLEKMVS